MNATNIMTEAQQRSGINVTVRQDGKFELAYANGTTKRPLVLSFLSDVALVLGEQITIDQMIAEC
jgi:hypothetical protein